MTDLLRHGVLSVNLLDLRVPKSKIKERKPCGLEMNALLVCIQGVPMDHVNCKDQMLRLEACLKQANAQGAKNKHKSTENYHLLRIARQAGVVARKKL